MYNKGLLSEGYSESMSCSWPWCAAGCLSVRPSVSRKHHMYACICVSQSTRRERSIEARA